VSNAIGYKKSWLFKNIIAEIMALVFVSWILGLVISYGFLTLVAKSVFEPMGQILSIFSNVSFDIQSGEFVSLLGPSGSGKSSLLYIVSLLKTPTAGEIYLDDVLISRAKNKNEIRYENFGFVFQHHFLIPHLTVLENVCTASYEKNVEKQAKDLLERLGLKDLMNQKPYKLSGGERQRVAIARAVVKKPRILFADEPTASLDHHTAQEIMKIFSELQENTTVVCATHDYGILPKTARILRIKNGKVVEDDRTGENE
jgi:ABC-type lipoprotein export system ATPase subunit